MKNRHDKWCKRLWFSNLVLMGLAFLAALTHHLFLSFGLAVLSVVPIIVDFVLYNEKCPMNDTRPTIALTYHIKSMKSHDGYRYAMTAWNNYHGVFLALPEYPNARYDQYQLHQDMHALAKKHGCYLAFRDMDAPLENI